VEERGGPAAEVTTGEGGVAASLLRCSPFGRSVMSGSAERLPKAKLFSKNSNLQYVIMISQRYGQTDRQTTRQLVTCCSNKRNHKLSAMSRKKPMVTKLSRFSRYGEYANR